MRILTSSLSITDGKESLLTRLVISHQVLNCIKCPLIGKCDFTRNLSNMAMEGRVDVDAIEALSTCELANLRSLLNAIRKSGDNKEFINRLLNLLIKGSVKSHLRIELLKEGSVITMDDFSLVVDNAKSMINKSIALSFNLIIKDSECTVELHKVSNDYLDYLIELVSRVVPNNEYSLSSLLLSREKFLSLFIKDPMLRSSLVLASLGLGDLAPVILDQEVEDIFITQDSIYINHSKHGICRVVNADAQAIAKQFLKIANISGVRVSVDNPSGKFSIMISNKRLRISVDRWPLVEGLSVHVRLHKKPFTINELINSGSISTEEAGKLIVALRNGFSILIMGPPSSGKTTLLNALDMALPLNLRRIYIDETDESLELPTPSIKIKSIIGKTEEVLKSLHRGYGVLIIGELRDRDHFEALIHGVNAGLQVLGTTHADSSEALMNRLRAFSLSELIDLSKFVLVSMERVGSVRRVKSITYPKSFNPGQQEVSAVVSVITRLNRVINDDYVEYSIQLNKLLSNGGGNEPK
ncbi:ATPase, T2SS/T4P/T4SS family [Vulcanisaeta distributa]|uniref:Type II secretion system protein E n=1 Tax=Vulcanisaeta distributa (strain DSM 14429 / JCM 11212 / NBRC 100878 / IC-017) TaxID=572478 RepID=E1QV41_VULDI|nr:ATPase, T2SS/T4P/T4SS family [Vulcanisaeta distributa]ADN51232.1 type II secretion system protein E [Vulcanisaeta distributa DSM 14429]